MSAFNLSAQVDGHGGQYAGHPERHVGVVTDADVDDLIGQQQRGVAILAGLHPLQFYIAHPHGTVFALQHEVSQREVIQSVVFNDGDDGCLLRGHAVDNHCDGYVVVGSTDSDGCQGNKE